MEKDVSQKSKSESFFTHLKWGAIGGIGTSLTAIALFYLLSTPIPFVPESLAYPLQDIIVLVLFNILLMIVGMVCLFMVTYSLRKTGGAMDNPNYRHTTLCFFGTYIISVLTIALILSLFDKLDSILFPTSTLVPLVFVIPLTRAIVRGMKKDPALGKSPWGIAKKYASAVAIILLVWLINNIIFFTPAFFMPEHPIYSSIANSWIGLILSVFTIAVYLVQIVLAILLVALRHKKTMLAALILSFIILSTYFYFDAGVCTMYGKMDVVYECDCIGFEKQMGYKTFGCFGIRTECYRVIYDIPPGAMAGPRINRTEVPCLMS